MRSHPTHSDEPPPGRQAFTWLRLLKLLLSIVLLAIGILEALGRLGVV
jgi:hypothetical protein